VRLAAEVGAAGPGVGCDAEGTTVACGRGEAVGIAAEVSAAAGGAGSVTEPRSPPALRPDTSSAIATEPTMRRRAAAQAAKGVRKLASASPEPMASRSLTRPTGRA
jgi:hypothetical protein